MMLDGAAAMLQGNVEAEEGCHKVRAEIVLKAWLLNAHSTSSKSQGTAICWRGGSPKTLAAKEALVC